MAEIKQAKFIDQTGQEKDAVFIGAEKAIFDDNGERLDHKMEERKKATGLVATDTSGIAGEAGLEVSLQVLIDSVAEKVVNELVTNSALTQTLANYMTKAMMSEAQVNDPEKVPTSALAFAMNQAITQNKNAITQLNSDWQVKAINLTSAMNTAIIEPSSYGQYCHAYKSGSVVTVCMFFQAKNLSGMDTIFSDGVIPEEYRPKLNFTFNITARNSGSWGAANFISAAIRFNTSGKVEIATGTEKAKAVYIDGTFSYISK